MSKFIIMSTLTVALVAGCLGVAEAQTGGGTGGGGGGGGGTRSAPTTTAAPTITTTAPTTTTTAPATTTTATTGTRNTTTEPCPEGLKHKDKNHPGRKAHPGCKQ